MVEVGARVLPGLYRGACKPEERRVIFPRTHWLPEHKKAANKRNDLLQLQRAIAFLQMIPTVPN
jgi:hypothetical protein